MAMQFDMRRVMEALLVLFDSMAVLGVDLFRNCRTQHSSSLMFCYILAS